MGDVRITEDATGFRLDATIDLEGRDPSGSIPFSYTPPPPPPMSPCPLCEPPRVRWTFTDGEPCDPCWRAYQDGLEDSYREEMRRDMERHVDLDDYWQVLGYPSYESFVRDYY